MFQCEHCEGFVPAQLKTCPNCQARSKTSLKRRIKLAAQLVLGASITMTLAACYGAPPPQLLPDCDGKESTTKVPCRPVTSPSPSPSTSATASPSASTSASPAASPSAAVSPMASPSGSESPAVLPSPTATPAQPNMG